MCVTYPRKGWHVSCPPGTQHTLTGWRGPHGSCFSTSWPAELKSRLQGRTGPSQIRISGAGCVWIPVSVRNRGLLVPPNFEDLWESGRRGAPFFTDPGRAAPTRLRGPPWGHGSVGVKLEVCWGGGVSL